jgi:hypothetical protein
LACGPRGEARRGFRTAGVQRGRKKGGGRRGAAGGDGRSERERRGEGGRVGLKDRRGVGPGVARAGGKGRRVAGLRLVAELRGPRGKEEGKGCWASGGPCGR